MKNTVIIIPTRLGAKRFPNKPLAKINNLPMIIQVFNRAVESEIGEVFVATPDREIVDIVKKSGGQAILTRDTHVNGTSRIFEIFNKLKAEKIDLIINLQGDLPAIQINCIKKLFQLMNENECEIGTLASFLNKDEIYDENVVKVEVNGKLKENSFLEARDFFRIKKNLKNDEIYHHIGIYAFTKDALKQYVRLPRSKLEIERNLEQMRAMENNIVINVGLSDSIPLSVDTEEDLIRIEEEIKKL